MAHLCDQPPTPCVLVTSPGLKPNGKVWTTDTPLLSSRASLAWAAKPVNAATSWLGISEFDLPTKRHHAFVLSTQPAPGECHYKFSDQKIAKQLAIMLAQSPMRTFELITQLSWKGMPTSMTPPQMNCASLQRGAEDHRTLVVDVPIAWRNEIDYLYMFFSATEGPTYRPQRALAFSRPNFQLARNAEVPTLNALVAKRSRKSQNNNNNKSTYDCAIHPQWNCERPPPLQCRGAMFSNLDSLLH